MATFSPKLASHVTKCHCPIRRYPALVALYSVHTTLLCIGSQSIGTAQAKCQTLAAEVAQIICVYMESESQPWCHSCCAGAMHLVL